MSDDTTIITKPKMRLPEWVWRGIAFAFLAGVIAWLQLKFVSRQEYLENNAKITATLESINQNTADIKQTMAVMNATTAQKDTRDGERNESNARTLLDHEQRLRMLERVIKP